MLLSQYTEEWCHAIFTIFIASSIAEFSLRQFKNSAVENLIYSNPLERINQTVMRDQLNR